jgi:hypothetical protein
MVADALTNVLPKDQDPVVQKFIQLGEKYTNLVQYVIT